MARLDWVDKLRKATPEERPALWREFYKATDPEGATPENEALEGYFRRIQFANQRFRESGDPGWLTDRGEVYVTLGEPDDVYDFSSDVSRAGVRENAEWLMQQPTKLADPKFFRDAGVVASNSLLIAALASGLTLAIILTMRFHRLIVYGLVVQRSSEVMLA